VPELAASAAEAPAILLEGVRVRFQAVEDRVTSFKEYVLERLMSRSRAREVRALDGVDLEVPPGQMVGVVGENGVGKTTLLKVAAGVLSPTEGRVRTEGSVVPLLGVGAGFQADLTGRENALLAMTILGISRREAAARLDGLVEFAELSDVINRPIRQYSAGMIARLGFAAGTAVRPDILLLDEVLAVGDERFQTKCLERIGDFCAAGTTVLLVSHSGSAISHCQRAVWVRNGRVVADGPPGEVLADYRRDGFADPGPTVVVPGETLSPGMPHPELPETEPVDDDELVGILRRRCGDPASPFHALRVFAELRDTACRLGYDLDRVVEVGPRSLPLVLACFAGVGADRVATVAPGHDPEIDELAVLKSYLGAVGGVGWWRYAADLYPGGTLDSDLLWSRVDFQQRVERVERIATLASGRLPFADGSFTFAYSVGSLAHVADPEVAVRECARILVPGGGVVHEIVFSDLDNPDTLADLKFTEEKWRQELDARDDSDGLFDVPPGVPPELAYSHRWRASDFADALDRHGFDDILVEPVIRLKVEAIDHDALAEPYRSKSLDDLSVVMARVCGRRK
jgi:ABC-type polysaccharide/polyol phosphate transport system ATPase subunit/SAM-dependent methyltransferase